jgi:hypothetical protein
VLHHLFRDYADPFLCRRAYHHAGVIPDWNAAIAAPS